LASPPEAQPIVIFANRWPVRYFGHTLADDVWVRSLISMHRAISVLQPSENPLIPITRQRCAPLATGAQRAGFSA